MSDEPRTDILELVLEIGNISDKLDTLVSRLQFAVDAIQNLVDKANQELAERQ